VSATCPAGHVSVTSDYCDTCGARIHAAPLSVAVDPAAVDTSATPTSAPCPHCGMARTGRDRYCEGCGFDFVAGTQVEDEPSAPQATCGWSIAFAPDLEHFVRTAPEGLSFPAAPAPPRTVTLNTSPLRIGRSRSSGEERPDIDLNGDPGVSRLHASLVRQDNGSWAIVDEGSSNGTTINEDDHAIAPHVIVPLQDGDRVHIGAWTTIVVTAAA